MAWRRKVFCCGKLFFDSEGTIMSSQFATLGRTSHRGGLTSLEFIGTLAALTCGVVLGSLFMGVDPQSLVQGVLTHAELVEPVENSKGDAKSSATDSDNENPANEPSEPSQPERHTTVMETESKPLHHAQSPGEPSLASFEAKTIDGDESTSVCPEATKAYWNVLTKCMDDEAIGRTGGITNPEEWQLLDYLTQRMKGHRKALDTLGRLDKRRVEPRVLHHSGQIVSWHNTGATLYEWAVKLLSDGPTADLTGPFAQSWQSSATQHRMEERLVYNRNAAVANYLDHAFPEQAPFAPARR